MKALICLYLGQIKTFLILIWALFAGHSALTPVICMNVVSKVNAMASRDLDFKELVQTHKKQ